MFQEKLQLDEKTFSCDLNNISQLDWLKLFLQKASYVQLSIFGICFLISVACLVISLWSLWLLKPTWCLSIFNICCRGKPVPTLLRRCLAACPTQPQDHPVPINETEMVPLLLNALNPTPTGSELDSANNFGTTLKYANWKKTFITPVQITFLGFKPHLSST